MTDLPGKHSYMQTRKLSTNLSSAINDYAEICITLDGRRKKIELYDLF